MKKIVVLSLCLFVCPVMASAQGTITLGGAASSKAGEEFATKAFQDPWDMSQRTDVGWWLFGTDEPQSNLDEHFVRQRHLFGAQYEHRFFVLRRRDRLRR